MTETPLTGSAARPRDAISGDQEAEGSSPGWLARLLARLGLGEEREGAREIIEEALEKEDATARSFSPQERLMLGNLLRFGALRVEDVMVPRADIIAIEESASVAGLLRVFQSAGHSRIPVYSGTLDDPRGMVHIKDLMSWITTQALQTAKKSKPAAPAKTGEGQAPVQAAVPEAALRLGRADLTTTVADTQLRREALFVPPSMSVLDLLLRMQTTRIHLALVVDEYGGTDGLVSIEDLVEEIVGEIEDEHDQNGAPLISDAGDDGLIADARVPIEELEQRLGLSLLPPERDEDVDTLGGLVFTLAGRVPVRGELVRHTSGIEFEVLDADARRIKKLRVHRNHMAS